MSTTNIPEEVIEAVLKYHDIVDTVGKYVHLTKRGKNYVGLCPFHSEKTPSFSVAHEKQIFHCFGCGAGGNSIKFIMEMEGMSFPEAVRTMAEDANVKIEWTEIPAELSEHQKGKSELLRAHDLTAKLFHYLLKNTDHGKLAMTYLKSRGFSEKLMEMYQIGYAPPSWDTLTQFLNKRSFELSKMEQGGLLSVKTDGSGFVDRFRDRVMFPICDVKGNVIAFAGRVLNDGQPKYLNSPETILFNKSRVLYNLQHARAGIRKSRQLVILEGYADVIKSWGAGLHNGVAAMGTALTEQHAGIIKRNADEVILCYDGDDAGQNAANKNIAVLEEAGCIVKVAILPKSMDPDEYITTYGAEAFMRDIIHNAVAALKYKLIYLKRSYHLQDDEDQVRYMRSAIKLIAEAASPVEREHYLKEVAAEFHYSFETLKQELHQTRQDLHKMKKTGDNKEIPWNNVMNDRGSVPSAPTLLPAYHKAERELLSAMIYHRDVAQYAEQQLGDQFNVEAHAALAAYLYAYYAQGRNSDASQFMALLQNDELESAASSISMIESTQGINQLVIDDYIRQIKKYPQQMAIERKKEDLIRAERSGDVIQAVKIAKEIIALEKQQKLT